MRPDWQQYINQKHGKDYQWQPFTKGSSNTLFRGVRGKDKLVVRVNALAKLTPGVDRIREAALLELIAKYKWSPNILENQVNQGWCAMQCYQPFNETALSNQQKSQVIDAIRELQLIDTRLVPEQQDFVIHYEKLWDGIYLPEAKKRKDKQALDWIIQIKQLLKSLPAVPTCFVHHDLHLGNLAIDESTIPNNVILLDWEYGGMGNPWIDAATLKIMLSISENDIAKLPAFRDLPPDQFSHGLNQAIELFDIISKIWHWLRACDDQ